MKSLPILSVSPVPPPRIYVVLFWFYRVVGMMETDWILFDGVNERTTLSIEKDVQNLNRFVKQK